MKDQMNSPNKQQDKILKADRTFIFNINQNNSSLQFDQSQLLKSPSQNPLKEQDFIPNYNVAQRDVIQDDNQKFENGQKKLNKSLLQSGRASPKSQMQQSQNINYSNNSLSSQYNLNYDQKFIKMLLSDESYKTKWHFRIRIFLRFVFIQLINPILQLIFILDQDNTESVKKSRKQKCLLAFFRVYFIVSSVFLWMALINYAYIKLKKPMNDSEYEFILNDYNKVLMYFLVIALGFTILNTAVFRNSSFFFILFKSLSVYTSTNIPKYMKELFISDHDFMFQFFNHSLEKEKKLKQKQKIKKIYRVNNLQFKYFQNQDIQQYYSGLDFCQKIVLYSENKNVENISIPLQQLIISLIVYFKAFIPGIYRYLADGHFEIYSTYLTVIPYLCVGNIVGYFARTINSLQDLNFIYDYNRALSALITYDSYLKLKPKHKINTPSINPVDIKSIKTWSQMRRLLNELKKEETIPIDGCTLLLFVYLILLFLAVFIDKIFHIVFIFSIRSDKYLLPYYTVDVLLISMLFCYRVYKQTKINDQYREQQKLLQNLQNILLKFFTNRESYQEKDNLILLDKDIQWLFYQQLNINYMSTLNTRDVFEKIHKESNQQFKNQYLNGIVGQVNILQNFDSDLQKFDYEYSVRLINLIQYIQTEIQMEILETPMKFMGLVPSSFGLLWAFLSFAAASVYLAFYLYLNDVK